MRASSYLNTFLANKRMALGSFAALLFLAQLLESHLGRLMPAIHGDWASHAATSFFIHGGYDLHSPAIKSVLNEFTIYPHITYWMASIISTVTELPVIYALTIVVQFSLILCALFYALRASDQLAGARISRIIISLIVIAAAVGIFKFSWRDLVISNSFITQLVSLAWAQIAIYLNSKCRRPWHQILLYACFSVWLVNIHVVGFAWFSATALLMALGAAGQSFRTRVLTVISMGILSGATLALSPGVLEMLRLAGTGGDLRVFAFINAPDHIGFVWMMAALYTIGVASIFAGGKLSLETLQRAAWTAAGFISLGPLIILSGITVVMKGGGWYPVVKWLPILVLEFALVLLLLKRPLKEFRLGAAAVTALAMLFFAVQLPFFRSSIDLEPGALAMSSTPSKTHAPAAQEAFPNLRVAHPALNYFIAKAVLEAPATPNYYSWLNGQPGNFALLEPSDFSAVPPTLKRGEHFATTSKNHEVWRVLNGNWWPPERTHTWGAVSPAVFSYYAQGKVSELLITGLPDLRHASTRTYSIGLNGKSVGTLDANTMDFQRPQTYHIQLAPYSLDNTNLLNISISWEKNAPDDLGFALVEVGFR
ncbi:hypothetical protein [Pseudomonas sp. UBA4194]|uniref:hypothetical protein n=1 Tax=Pseudomonas sp. UBA4194 TaxID=1947317 RepID=UPI0025FF4428|nr:hypothetical protein [Pseudomonas sp. UBA4194]